MTIAATLPLLASLPAPVALPELPSAGAGNTPVAVPMVGGMVPPVLPSDRPVAGGAFPALFAAAGDEIEALPLPAPSAAALPAKASVLAASVFVASQNETPTGVPQARALHPSLAVAPQALAARPGLSDMAAPVPDKVTEADPARPALVQRVPGQPAAAVVASEPALPTTPAWPPKAAAVVELPAGRFTASDGADAASRDGGIAVIRARSAAVLETGPVPVRKGRAPVAPEAEPPAFDPAITVSPVAIAILPSLALAPVSEPAIADAATPMPAAAPAIASAPSTIALEPVALVPQPSFPVADHPQGRDALPAPAPAPAAAAASASASAPAPAPVAAVLNANAFAAVNVGAPQRQPDAPVPPMVPDMPTTFPANAAFPVATVGSAPARAAATASTALPAPVRPANGQPVTGAATDRRSRVARSDMPDGALPALAGMPNAPPRAVIAGTDAVPLRAVPPMPEAALDMAVATDRLGDVRILVEGSANDLKVALGLAPATTLAASDVQRLAQGLAADLAAAGVRLQSLQVSGGGGGETFAGNVMGGGSAQGQSAQGQSAQSNREPPPGYPPPPPAIAAGTPRAPRSDRYA